MRRGKPSVRSSLDEFASSLVLRSFTSLSIECRAAAVPSHESTSSGDFGITRYHPLSGTQAGR